MPSRPRRLPDTAPLEDAGDLAAAMVAGIGRFLSREGAAAAAARADTWDPDFSSHEAYVRSLGSKRQHLRAILGVVDDREAPDLQVVGPATAPGAALAGGPGYDIFAARWPVLHGVDGEGLLLMPRGAAHATVIALPDCDTAPESWAGLTPGGAGPPPVACRLAASGLRVLVPCLIDRRDTHAGIPGVRMTNQPHREFIYRASFELGRHIIGYEIQKALAAVDALAGAAGPVGVFGHGEGGLIAFYAAALDPRIAAAAVSGYFQPREGLWQEPIYRNVFDLLRTFGDAEIAALIAPRALIVEAAPHPEIAGPPAPSDTRQGAAPGRLTTPPFEAVASEFERARKLVAPLQPPATFDLCRADAPGGDAALTALVDALAPRARLAPAAPRPTPNRPGCDTAARFKRQFDQLVDHTQAALREAEFRRAEYWSEADDTSLESWQRTAGAYRERLWQDVIGPLPPPSLPPNPRTRPLYDQPGYRAYAVMLDVYPDVFACGILLVPKRVAAGAPRPVVVCQHGLEGRCQRPTTPGDDDPAYQAFGCRLAERGFVVYAPQNPYIGFDRFRVLQRMANPLKLSLFSFIVRQHEQTLKWLATLPFVDAERIALYGISYGGKTAMRVPALLDGYCLSICSADYDEWIWKIASTRHVYSYVTTPEYEISEFNLGNTFNYAELSWLIFPRPFMVERGHHDGVAPDEWVAYEYARTRRHYVLLGHGDRTAIEYFDGPHAIHGQGTFDFLHEHLNWPKRRRSEART